MGSPAFVHLTTFCDDVEYVGEPANHASLKAWFPESEIRVWSVNAVRQLMLTRGDRVVLDAFDRLRPFAYKSDLASYYLLTTLGGWYTDLNNHFVAVPPETEEFSMVVFRDVLDVNAPWSIATTLMWAAPNNVALNRAIELVVGNCERRDYGRTPLGVTGPTLLGQAIGGVGLTPRTNYYTGMFYSSGPQKGLWTRDGELFARYKPEALGPGESGVPGGNHYPSMWFAGEVYAGPHARAYRPA
ncbi:MAG TPA: hypothetical protein VK139_08145 [Microbacteriaceae bacterium]|nr:hypothetical protein [Microbacteriaceae bacterium]